MTAYYNEWDKNAAAWLRELIKMGLIADGEVDERSITDVTAADLRGFTQHHFFAGIGVWSYSLRRAGWSDDLPVCTASLPCQPFSSAGKRKGKDDERHLLPHFLDLVKECDFPILFGEQVSPAIKQGWLDDLYDEMEQQGYTCGSSVLTAAGADSPHIRQRIYWAATRMAYTDGLRLQGQRGRRSEEERVAECGEIGGMGNPQHQQYERCIQEHREEFSENSRRQTGELTRSGEISRLGDTEHDGQPTSEINGSNDKASNKWRQKKSTDAREFAGASRPKMPANLSGHGEKREIDWLYCRDEKYRPIKSGIAPLVDGSARGMGHSGDSSISPNATSEARVMRLKGYGNAIQADVAAEFIGAVMECL